MLYLGDTLVIMEKEKEHRLYRLGKSIFLESSLVNYRKRLFL